MKKIVRAAFAALLIFAPLASSAASKKPAKPPVVTGVVTAVDGNNLTVAAVSKTYEVDLSGSTLMGIAAGDGLSFADVLAGDKVKITGAMSGDAFIAKDVTDLSFVGRNYFTGNVSSSLSENIISLNIDGNRYNNRPIDISSAVIMKKGKSGYAPVPATSLRIKDKLTVIGTLDGPTIMATAIRDDGAKASGRR